MFSIRQFFLRVKRHFRENLGAPFIVVFQVLLLMTASLLLVGNLDLANGIAAYAFLLLVVGVVLQMISLRKQEKRREKAENEE